MAEEFQIVDVWVGTFPSESQFDEYFEESYDRPDDAPISRFAADQQESFIDHDFLEASFHPTTDDFDSLLKDHSFAPSYGTAAKSAYISAGVKTANVLILVFGKEIQNPQSVVNPEYSLTYLGRFDCDPSPSSEGDAGPPAMIHLLVKDPHGLPFQGQTAFSIPVDSRGLTIGSSGSDSSIPRLDISSRVSEVPTDQVKIYQDQFDQWVIEDLAGNGLTRIDGEVLNKGRTFPWHGKRLTIGTLELEWSAE